MSMSIVMDEPKTVTPPVESSGKPFKSAHILFINSYMLTKNASKAAIAAGYSPSTAGQYGYQLLHNPRIAAEIKRLEQAELGKIAEREQRKQALAFSKDDFINESLTLYKEVSEPRDKARFLELAGKAQGYLNSDVNVNLNLGLFQNAAQELSSITSDHNSIRAELAPPANELKQVEHVQPQAQGGA